MVGQEAGEHQAEDQGGHHGQDDIMGITNSVSSGHLQIGMSSSSAELQSHAARSHHSHH